MMTPAQVVKHQSMSPCTQSFTGVTRMIARCQVIVSLRLLVSNHLQLCPS